MHRLLWIFPLTLFLGCSDQEISPPSGVLTPDRFARLYGDLLVAGITPGEAASDSSSRRRGVDSLLSLHGVTRPGWDSAVAWYNADVRRWRPLMESVTKELEAPPAPTPPLR